MNPIVLAKRYTAIRCCHFQASAGLGVFSLAYWSLFKDKAAKDPSSGNPSSQQQPDIVALLDKESHNTSNKYWQGDLESQDPERP